MAELDPAAKRKGRVKINGHGMNEQRIFEIDGRTRFSVVRLFGEYVRRQIYMHEMANKSLKISALLFLASIF